MLTCLEAALHATICQTKESTMKTIMKNDGYHPAVVWFVLFRALFFDWLLRLDQRKLPRRRHEV